MKKSFLIVVILVGISIGSAYGAMQQHLHTNELVASIDYSNFCPKDNFLSQVDTLLMKRNALLLTSLFAFLSIFLFYSFRKINSYNFQK
jgi:hypothetical protein